MIFQQLRGVSPEEYDRILQEWQDKVFIALVLTLALLAWINRDEIARVVRKVLRWMEKQGLIERRYEVRVYYERRR